MVALGTAPGFSQPGPQPIPHLTALGILLNNTGGSTPIYSSFDGQTAVSTDVLVKTTVYGDANLDGHVDASDYSDIDNGYLTNATGWSNGDFNYDGTINGSDYTLIDNAFNMQPGQPLPSDALFSGSSSDSPGGTATGADGGNPTATAFSGNVRYSDGSVTLSSSDIAPSESGLISGVTRTWTDETGLATNSTVGIDTVVTQQPSLVQEPSGALLAISGTSTKWFNATGSGFTENYFGQDTLTSDGSGGYLLTDSAGNRFDYFGFGSGITATEQGQLQSLTDPAGNVTNFTYSGGLLQQIDRTRLSDSAVLERDIYGYSGSQLSSVEVDREVNGVLTEVQTANYLYYGAGSGFGQSGELERATVSENGTPVNYDLYRYDPSSGLLLYAVEGDAYERLANITDPLTASNPTIAPYASEAFSYYGAADGSKNGKVKTQSLNGGTYIYSYDYLEDTGATALNTWRYKTIETLPDGNLNTVYTNTAGEVLLKVFTDLNDPGNTALSGQQWGTAYRFDSQGRLILSAGAASVTPNSSVELILSDPSSWTPNWYLNSTGLENLTDYYPSGPQTGYQDNTYVRQGYSGGGIVQSTATYSAHTGSNGITVNPLASDIVYRNTDGTGQETTNYTYTWQGGSVQPATETITYPTITIAENGPGQADSEIETFDPFGRDPDPGWGRVHQRHRL